MQGMRGVANRARAQTVQYQDNPSSRRCGLRPASDLTSDVRTAGLGPGGLAGHGAGDNGRLTRFSVAPPVPAGLKSRLARFIRRWQPGQSGEGDLLAGGQYTNLSVRQ
jgi:hypothetical protein